jgi:predicted PurR-regulated permease PerM
MTYIYPAAGPDAAGQPGPDRKIHLCPDQRHGQQHLHFFSKVLIIVFAPILAVYMIKDWEKIKAALLFILPPAARRETVILTSRIDAVWIEYLKGHLLVSALVGWLPVLPPS